MPDTTMALSHSLRDLIRTARTAAGLSQRQAAIAAKCSLSWWQMIETGTREQANAETVARMCYSIDISPEQLEAIGEADLAEQVATYRGFKEPQVSSVTEAAIWELPGATDEEKAALVSFLRTIRVVQPHRPVIRSAK
jgi:transcriptional regulator with XRE-family HTH domain